MKKLLFSLSLIAVLTACQSKSPETVAYTTLDGISATVKDAMLAYDQYIQTHEVSAEEKAIVVKVINSYLLAINTAQPIIARYEAGKATLSERDAAIKLASDSASSILGIVQAYLTK